jgi:FAD/FMN-containing dehydrogenase
MSVYNITNPTATLARAIENLVIYGERSNSLVKGACGVASRVISTLVFPIFLSFELIFKRTPKMLMAIGTDKFEKKADRALKFLYGIVPSMIFGLHSPEGMPGFFLKRPQSSREIAPFGVEKEFGTRINKIDYPKNAEEVQEIVKDAAGKGQQISVIGAGMSQGLQTVPKDHQQRVIHTMHLNHVKVNAEENTVTVGSGASWEQVQLELDKFNKSAIVKQASDIFSIGGSIGINCHGWAHEYGAMSSTVRSMKVIDAEGNLRTLMRPRSGIKIEDLTDDEKLFKCMFGTLGYFGVIVEAVLDIVDNNDLLEEAVEVDRDHFIEAYQTQVKGHDIPLFGGRLVLDMLNGDPMRHVYMVSYRNADSSVPLNERKITEEPKWGTRFQRIALKLISHLSDFSVQRLISHFWEQEKIDMLSGRVMTRNEALHPPIKAFKMFHNSNLHTQWLQEYFIEKERLPNFLRFLGAELKANDVRMINATIRPTPKDEISILPYAEKDRYAVVICFAQKKTEAEIAKTKNWIENVNSYLAAENGVFYQAYMPYATVEQFETCYGKERVDEMRRWKDYFDPNHLFGNGHTAKYYDRRAS